MREEYVGIKLFDVSGGLVGINLRLTNEGVYRIDSKELVLGMYIIKIELNKKVLYKKVLIKL